jgi:hypothetical protein
LGSVNITGKILACFAQAFHSTYPPPVEFVRATQAAIAGGAKGIIFEQYSTDLLEYQMFCRGHMPCVVVDKETIFRIIQSNDRYVFTLLQLVLHYMIDGLSCSGLFSCVTFASVVAKISPAATMVGAHVASPRVATFSSRGPSAQFPGILKVICIYLLLIG